MRVLAAPLAAPSRLIYLWPLSHGDDPEVTPQITFDSLLYLAQALRERTQPAEVEMIIVTRDACAVLPGEEVDPLQALCQGVSTALMPGL